MATQLKDLKFGDYTLKGETNSDEGTNYPLGTYDALTYEYTDAGGDWHEDPIIDRSWSLGSVNAWHLHGGADYAGCASKVDVAKGGTTQAIRLYGKTIPTFSRGSTVSTAELADWIISFVNVFSGGSSAYVITGTNDP